MQSKGEGRRQIHEGLGHRRRATGHAVVAMMILSAMMACGQGGNGTNGGRAAGDSATANVAENTPDPAKERSGVSNGTSRVIILGTSLTAGLGLDPEKAYPAVMQQLADSAGVPVRIVNAGLSGETSAGALRRAAWVLDQPADVVLLEVGANDGLRGVDPDSTYANLIRLVDSVRTHQPAAKVALVQMEAPTNLGPKYTRAFHDAYGRAAKDRGVALLPFLLEGVAGEATLNQGDGIHPNQEGARRVALTMWNGLRPLLPPN